MLGEKHPFVMVFYLTLLTGGVLVFVLEARKLLFVSNYIRPFHVYIIPLLVIAPYVTLYRVATSDPGRITEHNLNKYLQLYPFDDLIFLPRQICRTCHFEKPARSKHCSLCKACIARHDHHCAWVNNCIGYGNTYLFFYFLLSTLILTIYGVFIMSALLQDYIDVYVARGLWTNVGLFYKWWRAIKGLNNIGALWLFTIFCSILSVAFTLYQAYLVFSGTTTNETVKWQDIAYAIKHRDLLIYDGLNDDEVDKNSRYYQHSSGARKQQIIFRDTEGNFSDPRSPFARPINGLAEVDNIYDLGWKRNFIDVFNPLTIKS